jgi:multidrug resistance protein, MATE family
MTKGASAAAWRTEGWAMLVLAGPVALGQLLQMGMNLTDMLVIGHLGKEPLAAAALAQGLWVFFWFFGMGLATVTAPMLAQAQGEGDTAGQARILRQGLGLNSLIGLGIALFLGSSETLLLWLGQAPALATEAAHYLDALRWSIPPLLLMTVVRNLLVTYHRANLSLVFAAGAFGVNAALDLLLVFGGQSIGLPWIPAFGLIGAGIATATGCWLMVAAMLVYIITQAPFAPLWKAGGAWWPEAALWRRMLTLGLPISITMVMEVGLFAIAGIMMGWLGTDALAAHQIAILLASLTFMVPWGISQAATVRIAAAVGRGEPEAAVRAGWVAQGLGLAVMGSAAVIFWLVPYPLARQFLDAGAAANVAVLELAVTYLAIAALFQLFDGMQVIGTASLRGLSDTRVPMLFAVLGYWGVGLTTSYLLGFVLDWKGVGVWIGLALGLATVSFLMVWRFRALTQGGGRAIPQPV